MAGNVKSSFVYILHVLCLSLVIYTSAFLVFRYFKNEDSPKISYKKFNKEYEDVYPEITICFTNGVDKFYNTDYLSEQFGSDFGIYHKYITGKLIGEKKSKMQKLKSQWLIMIMLH